MIAVSTAAVTMDGIDPAILIPAACLLVGLVLGLTLGLNVHRREMERKDRRILWLTNHLDRVCGFIDADTDTKPRACTPVEVPE